MSVREADERMVECVCGASIEIPLTGTSALVDVVYSGQCEVCGRRLSLEVQAKRPEPEPKKKGARR
jgi:hypothetical protein